MPKIIEDIVGSIEILLGFILMIIPGAQSLAYALIISGATTLLAGLLSPGLNRPQGMTVSSRDPNAPWRTVYGQVRLAGVVTFLGTHGNNNGYLDIVLTLAKGKLHSIDTMYFNGTAIPLDSNGNGQGIWAGYVHTEWDLGDPNNTNQPFPGLASCQPGYWNGTCLQRGHAKAYVRLQWSSTLFVNGCPNITFDVHGREVYDPRTDTTGFSSNPALCLRDYLLDLTIGLQCDHTTVDNNGQVTASAEINDTAVIAAANTCDQLITLLGCVQTAVPASGYQGTGYVAGDLVNVYGGNGGCALWVAQVTASGQVQKLNVVTPGATYANASDVSCSGGHGSGLAVNITTDNGQENQYTCNGVFDSTQSPSGIINDICNSMAGYLPYIDGRFTPLAGVYPTPTITLGDDDFRAPLEVQATISRRDIFNSIHGSYLSAGNNWQATDWPAIINGSYVNEDGVILWTQVDFPFTTSPSMCQRIANIFLQRNRRQVTVTAKCKLTAADIAPGDTIMVTHARFGWNQKTFFVQDAQFVIEKDVESGENDESAALGVDLLLRETDVDVYAWTTAQQQGATPPAGGPTPNPTTVQPVTGLDAVSGPSTAINQIDGSVINQIFVAWNAPTDQFVLDGGQIIVQWEVIGSPPTNMGSAVVPGSTVSYWISPVVPNQTYLITVYAMNCKGASSAPSSVEVGGGAARGMLNDYCGVWQANTQYYINNEVSCAGNLYICLQPNLNTYPPDNCGINNDWLLIGPQTLDDLSDHGIYVHPPRHTGAEGAVENGNFMNGTAGWELLSGGGSFAVSQSSPVTGPLTSSWVGVVTDSDTNWTQIANTRKFALMPGEFYKVGGYLYTPTLDSSGNGGSIQLQFYDGNDQYISSLIAAQTRAAKWQYLTACGQVPADTQYALFVLCPYDPSSLPDNMVTCYCIVNTWRVRSLDDEVADGTTYQRVAGVRGNQVQTDSIAVGAVSANTPGSCNAVTLTTDETTLITLTLTCNNGIVSIVCSGDYTVGIQGVIATFRIRKGSSSGTVLAYFSQTCFVATTDQALVLTALDTSAGAGSESYVITGQLSSASSGSSVSHADAAAINIKV